MSRAAAIRIAMIGPSGSGKSTAAGELVDAYMQAGLRCGIYKLAQPLYRLQRQFYEAAGRGIGSDEQDQTLLETIATRLRAISPTCLVDDLGRRLDTADEDVVLNDDLRDDDVDWPYMRSLGFRIVRIVTPESVRRSRLGSRGDLTSIPDSMLDRQMARIPADFVLTNGSDGIDGLRSQVRRLVRHLGGGNA